MCPIAGDNVYYSLSLGVNYSPKNNLHQCLSGQSAGLVFVYEESSNQNIAQIPYGETVEFPFYVENVGPCTTYTNVKVMAIATCERSTSSSQVFQYGVVPGIYPVQISYDKNDRIYASNSIATFSVSWVSSRRLLYDETESNPQTFHDFEETKSELLTHIENLTQQQKKEVMGLVESQRNEIMEKIDDQSNEIRRIVQAEIRKAFESIMEGKHDNIEEK